MRNINYFPVSLILCVAFSFGAFNMTAYSQAKDVVLAQGNPPLTQSMVNKTVDFLEWVLEIELSAEHKTKIRKVAIQAWKTKTAEEIESTVNIADLQDKLMPMSEDERNFQKRQMQPAVLKNLRGQPDDEMSRTMVLLYEAAHSTSATIVSPANVANASAKNTMRVGADGFTGIYRMLRPRAININNSGPEPGYWIEYITFLPGGYVYWTLPPEGLLYFDAAVAQRAYPDDWGTYEIKNGEIHIRRGPAKELYVITRTGERLNNPPSLGKGSFRPVPAADGLRLEGNYRRSETEPAITFTKDGNFRDEGVFRFFGDLARPNGTVYQDDGRGGSGTYLIEQNTLELRYSDGRVKRHPFMAFPENLAKKPAVDSFILRSEETMKLY